MRAALGVVEWFDIFEMTRWWDCGCFGTRCGGLVEGCCWFFFFFLSRGGVFDRGCY